MRRRPRIPGRLVLAAGMILLLLEGEARPEEDVGPVPAEPTGEEEVVEPGEVGGLLGIFWPTEAEPGDASRVEPAPDELEAAEAPPVEPAPSKPEAAEVSPVESGPGAPDEVGEGLPEAEKGEAPAAEVAAPESAPPEPATAPVEDSQAPVMPAETPAVPVLGAEPERDSGPPDLAEEPGPGSPVDDPEPPSGVPAASLPDEDDGREAPVVLEEEAVVRPAPAPRPDLDADLRASRRPAPLATDDPDGIELPTEEIYGEIEKPDIFFLLPKARSKSDEQLIRSRIRREITRPLIKDWLEEELLLK